MAREALELFGIGTSCFYFGYVSLDLPRLLKLTHVGGNPVTPLGALLAWIFFGRERSKSLGGLKPQCADAGSAEPNSPRAERLSLPAED